MGHRDWKVEFDGFIVRSSTVILKESFDKLPRSVTVAPSVAQLLMQNRSFVISPPGDPLAIEYSVGMIDKMEIKVDPYLNSEETIAVVDVKEKIKVEWG